MIKTIIKNDKAIYINMKNADADKISNSEMGKQAWFF